MGEIIHTKFSPDELVLWERKSGSEFRKGNTDLTSEHKISSIRIDIFNSYKWKAVEGKVESIKGTWFSLLSFINFSNHRKASDYGKKANECFKKVRDNKEVETSGIEYKISYILQGYVNPVPEEELTAIPIEEYVD